MIAPRTIPHSHRLALLRDYFRHDYCPARAEELSKTTRGIYLAAFSMLGKHLGHPATFADLTSEMISAFMAWLVSSQRRSPAPANSYGRGIQAMGGFRPQK